METNNTTSREERFDALIEECVAIRGNKDIDGSYSAPRELYRKVLKKYGNSLLDELLSEVGEEIVPENLFAKGQADERSRVRAIINHKKASPLTT